MKRRKSSTTRTTVDQSRRRMLGGVIGASAAAGLGLVTLGSRSAPAVAETTESRESGYRETEHVRRYYRSAEI